MRSFSPSALSLPVLLALLIPLAGALPAADRPAVPPAAVSAQGIIRPTPSPLIQVSPGGSCVLEISWVTASSGMLAADLQVTNDEGIRSFLPRVPGEGFLVSDSGRVVAIGAPEASRLPARIAVLDPQAGESGEWEVFSREAFGLSDPRLSADGLSLAFREGGEIVVLDLESLAEQRHPNLGRFAAGPEGLLAGAPPDGGQELLVRGEGGEIFRAPLLGRLRQAAFSPDGATLFAITSTTLLRVSLACGPARLEEIFLAPEGAELRDLRLSPVGILLGLRRIEQGVASGELLTLAPDGRLLAREAGPSRSMPCASGLPWTSRGIPWPLLPDSTHPVGNTYGEYQNYGGAPYLHPGVDVFGSAGQAVYAVRAGVVKAVLTTDAEWHWRVAVGDSGGSGTTQGYLYAHLDQPSIAVDVGDTVTLGQYLGDLVEWPIYDFTHCHFARIQDSGTQWDGSWLCTENPHLDFDHKNELLPPAFEPAQGSNLLAFCGNETSTYQSPSALHGQVDIVAHVGDRIASSWVCTVQEIRYTIYPQGQPGSPVVDDKQAVFFDMALDTYQGGPIDPFLVDLFFKQDSTCHTYGDYDYREFYHVISNSDGDGVYESADVQEAWDTSLLPDGPYVVEVTATDVSGNSTTQSMTVTTANGNLATVDASLTCLPASGTLPFVTAMTAMLDSLYAQQLRRIAGRIDVDLAGGQHYSNWRSGWTNITAGGSYTTAWNQVLPALGSLAGPNVFRLLAVDVTPSPYNQPPYPAAGDTASDTCTVTGLEP